MLDRKAASPFPTLIERFVTYAKIHTTSNDESDTYPSTDRQFDLARLLVDELKAVGLSDATVDDNCYVTASIPASDGCQNVPVIAFISHMDTYPEVSGENVVPTFHENYQGGDIDLPKEGRNILADENPYLAKCIGETIITADGTTLLGADDKAGIAEILEALTLIHENPEWKHGLVKVAFTPDEEVGQGVKHFDVEKFGATVAYTMDGGQRGEVENETFCADSAIVTFVGRDIHPGYAKDKMIPSVKLAGEFIASLPREGAPHGGLHPSHQHQGQHQRNRGPPADPRFLPGWPAAQGRDDRQVRRGSLREMAQFQLQDRDQGILPEHEVRPGKGTSRHGLCPGSGPTGGHGASPGFDPGRNRRVNPVGQGSADTEHFHRGAGFSRLRRVDLCQGYGFGYRDHS